MVERQGSATFHIICSDQSRTGKTLYARLVADYLDLCGRRPLIFDASGAAGGIAGYFPIRGLSVDITSTPGQMALLDRALEAPLHDCVVDVPPHLNSRFFDLLRSIDFGETARDKGLNVAVHFVVGRSESSLIAGSTLRAGSSFDRFIIVRNA